VTPERVVPLEDVTGSRAKKAAKTRGDPDVLGIAISHPDRVYYPEQKVTKLDIARYYETVAEVMLPHVANRPLALVRCPDGIGGQCFFQKHAGAGLPKAIREVRTGDRPEDTVLVIDSAEGLVSLVQRGVLEIHLWGSHLRTIEKPDLLVFDFDPDPAVKWPAVVQAAFEMRGFLEDLGLESFAKTTGGKGLHVVVPIRPMLAWDAVKEFTRLVSTRFSDRAPDRFLVNMSKTKRTGRIFVDYLRNGRGATAIAPYSTRSRPGAQIATPVSWKELEDGAVPADFTVATIPERIGTRFKDPWAKIASVRQAITAKMIKSLSD
jgi:bifunctional non-homologous end joining protein LigD